MRRPRMLARRAGIAVLVGGVATTLAVTSTATTPASGEPERSEPDPVQVVMVDAPTVAQRNEVIDLGLDITEHATRKGIEVVLYDDADRRALRQAGFDWTVEVADLEAQTRADRRADRRYAASVARSPLPSVAGTYTVIAENYEGGSAEDDWEGEVTFQSPDPPTYTGIKEKWVLSCTNPRGRVLSTRAVIVDRGETVAVRQVCSRARAKR